MVRSRQWSALALLVLSVMLRRDSALRTRGPGPHAAEKGLHGLDYDNAQLALAAEYESNFSHVRECATAHTWNGQLSPQPLVVPSLKLAFCYVPKVACTQFKDLFNHLNHLDTKDGFPHDYLASSVEKLGISRSSVSRENGWKFAMFTRDPALRYLSAFGSTCVAKDDGTFEHDIECCGPLVKDNLMQPELLVKMFETRLMYDHAQGSVSQEQHWSQQTEILMLCGWEDFRPEKVDFHGSISDGDVNQQVKEMLAMVNGSEPWRTELVDKYFPEDSVAGHQTPIQQIPPEVFYRNRTVLSAVGKLYEDDIDLIPKVGKGFYDVELKKPDWQREEEAAAAFNEASRNIAQRRQERDVRRQEEWAEQEE
uniref:Sulfotransferase domain-containing protein n=1 Tax=Alexandrium andersonii TaxID=327968 RepID=A0A7S2DSM8_9DINO